MPKRHHRMACYYASWAGTPRSLKRGSIMQHETRNLASLQNMRAEKPGSIHSPNNGGPLQGYEVAQPRRVPCGMSSFWYPLMLSLGMRYLRVSD